MKNLNLRIEALGDSHVVRLNGRLDAALSAQLDVALRPLISQQQSKIAIDFTHINYLSTSGIRVILSATKNSHQQGGKVVIFGVHRSVMEIIKIAGFEKILYFYPSEQDATTTLAS